MSANPSRKDWLEGRSFNSDEERKLYEFCYELTLEIRRITGRTVAKGLEDLPDTVREAIQEANKIDLNHQSPQV